MDKKKLTDKQRTFCEEYMIDLNATQAAIRAGYSEKTAQAISTENLSKPLIKEYLAELQSKRSEKTEITAETVLRELQNWAYGDFTELMEMTFEDIKSLPKEVRRLITGFEKNTTTFGEDGKKEVFKVRFVDKSKAMDMIARHISFYAPEEKINLNVEQPLFPETPTKEQ